MCRWLSFLYFQTKIYFDFFVTVSIYYSTLNKYESRARRQCHLKQRSLFDGHKIYEACSLLLYIKYIPARYLGNRVLGDYESLRGYQN